MVTSSYHRAFTTSHPASNQSVACTCEEVLDLLSYQPTCLLTYLLTDSCTCDSGTGKARPTICASQ